MNKITEVAVPKCGSSDKRNTEYEANYSTEKFFHSLIDNPKPVIFDVGAHKGESIKFFKNIFRSAEVFSFEPSPENFRELELVANDFGTKALNVAIGEVSVTSLFINRIYLTSGACCQLIAIQKTL